MNRRRRKKQQTHLWDEVKKYYSAIDWHGLGQRMIHSSFWRKTLELWARLPVYHQRTLMVLVPLLLVLLLLPSSDKPIQEAQVAASSARVTVPINTQGLSQQQRVEASQPSVISPISEPEKTWQEYIIKQGDTLTHVFRSNNLPLSDLNALVRIEGNDRPLSQIQQGQLIRFKLNVDGQLDILQLERNNQSVIFFRLADGTFGRSQ